MNLYPAVTLTLGVWAILGSAAAVALFAMTLIPAGRARIRAALGGSGRQPIAGAWVTALVAMAGSLYFSAVVGFAPCVLCWYQRIMMYPLVLLLAMALLLRERGAWRVTIVLPITGLVIALYHVAVQYRPEMEILACEGSIPCGGRYLAVFGFISIPVLAASAFLLITSLMVTAAVAESQTEEPETAAP